MIVIVHQHNKTTKILDRNKHAVNAVVGETVTKTLNNLAEKFPETLLVWCHESYLEDLNIDAIATIFHHKRIMASFSLQKKIFYQNKLVM